MARAGPGLVALFLNFGIRAGEAVAFGMASVTGPPGARRFEVAGKGDKTRTSPSTHLERVLATYEASRTSRYPDHDLDHDLDRPATPLLAETRGRRLAAHQISYLIEGLYTRAGIRSASPQVPWSTHSATPSPPTP